MNFILTLDYIFISTIFFIALKAIATTYVVINTQVEQHYIEKSILLTAFSVSRSIEVDEW